MFHVWFFTSGSFLVYEKLIGTKKSCCKYESWVSCMKIKKNSSLVYIRCLHVYHNAIEFWVDFLHLSHAHLSAVNHKTVLCSIVSTKLVSSSASFRCIINQSWVHCIFVCIFSYRNTRNSVKIPSEVWVSFKSISTSKVLN